MSMPVRACPGREADVVAHAGRILGLENGIHVDGAAEGLRGLARGRVGGVGGADELHGLDCLLFLFGMVAWSELFWI